MLIKITGVIWKVIPRKTRTWLTRRFHPTFTVSAAGIITNERGEVLLLDHVLRPVSGWGVPGGFLETGEQPDEGLRREIREETGIDLENIKLYRCRTQRRHIEIIMTAKGVGEPRVMSREITALAWFPLDQMPAAMSIDQKLLIRAALNRPA
jgi:8-oxo-dGTP diphosphatase